MAITVSFINDNQNHDATEWANYFRKFITNGVFTNPATGLYCTKTAANKISLAAGAGWIDGVMIENTAPLEFTLDETPSSRRDRVVMRLDLSVPTGMFTILKGTDGSTVPTDLANTTSKKELCLAEILLDTNGILSVTDKRGTDLCGFVQNFLGAPDASGLFANFETEFAQVMTEANSAIDEIEATADGILGAFVGGKYENAVINPDFRIDQRGGGAVHSVGAGQQYTLDRWLFRVDGTPSAAYGISSRNFDGVSANNQPATAVLINTKAINGAGMASLAQFIENGVANFAGGKVTVAFKAYAQTAQKLAVNLRARYKATDFQNILAPAFNVNNTWQRYVVTFTVPKRAFDETNNIKLSFFTTWAGDEANTRFETTSDNNIANTIYIADVVMCQGENALPFVPRFEADEMARCRRYYRKQGLSSLAAGVQKTADKTVKTQMLDFEEMRTAPTITVTDKAGTVGKASWENISGGTSNGHAVSVTTNNDGFNPCFVVQPATTTQAQAASIIFGSIQADAEVYA